HDPAAPPLYTLSLHDALPISLRFAPTVHGDGDHGFMAVLVDVARRRGASGFVGDGGNRWPAVHRRDAAHLVALALEGAPAGSVVDRKSTRLNSSHDQISYAVF